MTQMTHMTQYGGRYAEAQTFNTAAHARSAPVAAGLRLFTFAIAVFA